jgi:hypothetical protein
MVVNISGNIKHYAKNVKNGNDKDRHAKFLIYVWLRPARHKDSLQFPRTNSCGRVGFLLRWGHLREVNLDAVSQHCVFAFIQVFDT